MWQALQLLYITPKTQPEKPLLIGDEMRTTATSPSTLGLVPQKRRRLQQLQQTHRSTKQTCVEDKNDIRMLPVRRISVEFLSDMHPDISA